MKKIFILIILAFATPVYAYNNSYYSNTSPLGASCYRTPVSTNIGDSISWGVSAYGGNGNYYISWSGSEGLSGNGTSITKRYNNSGTKNASVTVVSGNQTISKNCDSVEIYDYNYYNSNDNYRYYNRDYRNNDYYNNNYYVYDSPLYVSCSVNTSFALAGANVTWQANISGGNGSYSYSWSGSDYLRGYGKYLNVSYNSLGVKTASVTVYSGNQTITQACSNNITIGVPNYNQYNQNYYPYNVNNGNYISNNINNDFQVACYPNKTSIKSGNSMTWIAEAVAPAGGYGNLSYEWSGTDGLYGNQSSIIKTYGNTGAKTANVTVIANNGQRVNKVCNNIVYVSDNSNTVAKNSKSDSSVAKSDIKTNNNSDRNNANSANSLFLLNSVPWGFVAITVIVILLSVIFYLLFNKNKI